MAASANLNRCRQTELLALQGTARKTNDSEKDAGVLQCRRLRLVSKRAFHADRGEVCSGAGCSFAERMLPQGF